MNIYWVVTDYPSHNLINVHTVILTSLMMMLTARKEMEYANFAEELQRWGTFYQCTDHAFIICKLEK